MTVGEVSSRVGLHELLVYMPIERAAETLQASARRIVYADTHQRKPS